ncbi:MAG: AAA family ATPase, partial [Oscillospiraceae bacterium]|nr:AAA family ATPase [Oscillospiraceae bacterium]
RSSVNPLDEVHQAITRDELLIMQETAAQVYVDEAIYHYIAELAAATRKHELVRLGVSPRGSLALCAVSRAVALIRGRDYVVPDDISVIIRETFAHRMLLSNRARAENIEAEDIIGEILSSVRVPELQGKER